MGLKSRRRTAPTLPDLDEACGKHFTYRALVECGETWLTAAKSAIPIDNAPRAAESYEALRRLCDKVLDPLVDHFGPISLTYGFAGARLVRTIRRQRGRVQPQLDQHASFELNLRGNRICERGGAAADLVIAHTSARDAAAWLQANTDFDRIYFYGDEKPLHVSTSTSPAGQIIEMRSYGGRLVPRVLHRGLP